MPYAKQNSPMLTGRLFSRRSLAAAVALARESVRSGDLTPSTHRMRIITVKGLFIN